jgi:D-alanine transaminase
MMSPMTAGSPTLYLNGEYVDASTAGVSVEDRGFLFADACYEVTAVFDGTPIALDRHLARLQRGLDVLRIEFDASTLVPVHHELIERNGLGAVPRASVYVHITRGVAPRSHAFPPGAAPTVLVRAQEIPGPSADVVESGTRAITHPDDRWGRVDIKTTGLLPNVLAQQAAIDAGVEDVILHRDGVVTEGSRTNVLAVLDGSIVTAPADHNILAGVTRGIVLELADAVGHTATAREWTLDELSAADEVLMTSTTSGVRPIVVIDGRPVGAGGRGPITISLQEAYAAFVDDIVGHKGD